MYSDKDRYRRIQENSVYGFYASAGEKRTKKVKRRSPYSGIHVATTLIEDDNTTVAHLDTEMSPPILHPLYY